MTHFRLKSLTCFFEVPIPGFTKRATAKVAELQFPLLSSSPEYTLKGTTFKIISGYVLTVVPCILEDALPVLNRYLLYTRDITLSSKPSSLSKTAGSQIFVF